MSATALTRDSRRELLEPVVAALEVAAHALADTESGPGEDRDEALRLLEHARATLVRQWFASDYGQDELF